MFVSQFTKDNNVYLEFIHFTVMFEILLLEKLFFGDLSVVVNTNGDSVSSRKS